MGNANVNVGGFGFDYSKDGGGVTVDGIRVGAGKNGAEIGTNIGFGAQVDGKGAYAGAGTKVTVGRDGVNGSAGAIAVGGDQEAGAGAEAGVGWDGETHANAVATPSAEVNNTRALLNDSKNDLDHFLLNLQKAEQNEGASKRNCRNAAEAVETLEEELRRLKERRSEVAKEKTDLTNDK